jgi:hypothetical protein
LQLTWQWTRRLRIKDLRAFSNLNIQGSRLATGYVHVEGICSARVIGFQITCPALFWFRLRPVHPREFLLSKRRIAEHFHCDLVLGCPFWEVAVQRESHLECFHCASILRHPILSTLYVQRHRVLSGSVPVALLGRAPEVAWRPRPRSKPR